MLTLLLLLACSPDPGLTIVAPDGPLGGVVPITVTGTADTLSIVAAGAELALGPGPTLSTTWDTTLVEDGTHLLHAFAFKGNATFDTVLEVEVAQGAADRDAPVVTFALPEVGAQLDRDAVDVRFDVTDDSPLASVTLLEGETVIAELPTEGPWELRLTELMAGGHTFEARAEDVAGNVGSATRSFEVTDINAVSCSITRPDAGDTVTGVVTVSVAASSEAGVRRLQVFADDVEVGSDNASPWQVDWDTSAVEAGPVQIRALVTDANAESCETTLDVEVGEQSEPFGVEVTGPTDGSTVSGASVRVRARVGGGYGVERLDFFVDDVSYGSLTASPWEFLLDSTGLSDGAHTLRLDGVERTTGAVVSDAVSVTVANGAR